MPNGRPKYGKTFYGFDSPSGKIELSINCHALMRAYDNYKAKRDSEDNTHGDLVPVSEWRWKEDKECAHHCHYGRNGCALGSHQEVVPKNENKRCSNLNCYGFLVCKNEKHKKSGLFLAVFCPYGTCRRNKIVQACYVCSPTTLPDENDIEPDSPEYPVSPKKARHS